MREHRKDTPKKMVDLVEQYSMDEFVIINDQAESVFAYNSDMDIVEINPSHHMFDTYDYKEAMIHEIAHRIDKNEFGSPMNLDFSKAIVDAEKRLLTNKNKYKKMFELGGKFEYNGPISDIVGCITDNAIVGRFSHESQYIGIPGYTELEVFANIFSVLYQGDDEAVDFVKKELSEVYKAFLNIVGE